MNPNLEPTDVIDTLNPVDSANQSNKFSTAAWWMLLATIGLTPIAIGALPFQDPFLWSWKFVLHNIVLLTGVGLSGIAFAGALLFEKRTIKTHWTLWVVLAAFVGAVVSTVFADDKLVAIIGEGEDLLSLVAVGSLGLLYFLTVQTVDNRQRVEQIITAFIGSSTVMALVALSSQLFQLRMFTPDWADVIGTRYLYERGGEMMGNPDAVGVIIAMGSIVLLWRVLYSDTIKQRLLYGVLGAVVMSATILTLQRAAWVGLVAGFILVLGYALKTKRLHVKHAGMLVLVLVVLAAGVTPFFNDSHIADKLATVFEDLFAEKAFSRVTMYGEAIDMITDHPVTGVGPVNYRVNWFQYRADVSIQAASGYYVFDPHSLPLFVAVSFGLPVFLLIVALIAGSLGCSRRLIRESSESDLFAIVVITLLVGILMSSVNPTSTTFLMYLTLWCAIPVAFLAGSQHVSNAQAVIRMSAVTLAVLVGLCSIGLGVTQFIGYWQMDQAQNTETRLQGTYEFLKVGASYPYIMQSAQIGIRYANDEVVETRAEMHPDVHAMVMKSAELHPNDFMTLREVGKYLLNYGAVMRDTQLFEQGIAVAERAIELCPYDSQMYLAYITGLANAGRIDDARAAAADYLKVVPKDGSIQQLAINLENVKQDSGAQW